MSTVHDLQSRLNAIPPSAPAGEAAAGVAGAPGMPAARRRRLMVLGVVATVALGAAGYYGQRWWSVGRFAVSTDDAYVRADNTTLAAKVSGYVSAIKVADNAQVSAGDVIATIDDGDYRLAVAAAAGKVATQRASVERIGRQIDAQRAAVAQTTAQLGSAEAGQKLAEADLDRQQALAAKDFASRQALERAVAGRDQAIASVASARAGVAAAEANLAVLAAQQQEALRALDELETARAKAERDLSFTQIRAPVDGVFGNRAMNIGDFVQTGQRLASLVPLDAVFVDANFKETQLDRLRPGQRVSISVDALPGRSIDGTVASLAPASGSVFSLLPADNATGNFTKIVQRVPVRIRVPADVAGESLLRPGMSVVVSVDTKDMPAAAALPRRTRTAAARPAD